MKHTRSARSSAIVLALGLDGVALAKQPFCSLEHPLYLKDEVVGFSLSYGEWAVKRTQALCQASGSSVAKDMTELKLITYYEVYDRSADLKSRYFGGGMTQKSYRKFLQGGGRPMSWATAAEDSGIQPEEKFDERFGKGGFKPVSASQTDPNKGNCTLDLMEVIFDPRKPSRQLMMIGKRRLWNDSTHLSSYPNTPVFLHRTGELPSIGTAYTATPYWEPLEQKYIGKRGPSIFVTLYHKVTIDGVTYPNAGFDIISDQDSAKDPTNITDRVFECVYR